VLFFVRGIFPKGATQAYVDARHFRDIVSWLSAEILQQLQNKSKQLCLSGLQPR